MRRTRALVVALLSAAVLVQGAAAAIAAPGDPDLKREFQCANTPAKIGKNLVGKCDLTARFKPGTTKDLADKWLRVTVPYSIWVQREGTTELKRIARAELTITRDSKKDANGYFVTSVSEALAVFGVCDKIEMRWGEAPVVGEDPKTLKDVELHKFAAEGWKTTFGGSDCKEGDDELSVSVTLPDNQATGDWELLANDGNAAEPTGVSAGGGVESQ